MKSEELRRSEMFCLHYFICRSYGAPTILNAKLLLACHSLRSLPNRHWTCNRQFAIGANNSWLM